MNDSIITSLGAIIFGGGAVAIFWRPLMSGLANIVTGNQANGAIISGYKEQVEQLKSDNALLREQNNELRARHDENIIRISALETDLKVIKNALRFMLSMSGANLDDRFRSEVSALIGELGGGNDD